MNDFFIKKLNKKRIKSSRTQNFFFQKIKNQNKFFFILKKKRKKKEEEEKTRSQGLDSQVKHTSSHNKIKKEKKLTYNTSRRG